jgi:hypothetical protein
VSPIEDLPGPVRGFPAVRDPETLGERIDDEKSGVVARARVRSARIAQADDEAEPSDR